LTASSPHRARTKYLHLTRAAITSSFTCGRMCLSIPRARPVAPSSPCPEPATPPTRVRDATSARCLLRCMSPSLAQTPRSLHCRASDRLRCYFLRLGAAACRTVHDPSRKKLPNSRTALSACPAYHRHARRLQSDQLGVAPASMNVGATSPMPGCGPAARSKLRAPATAGRTRLQ
jgi:hypothetical protein